MDNFSWTCPVCDRPTTITDNDRKAGETVLAINNKEGERKAITTFIVCPNPECKKFTLSISVNRTRRIAGTTSYYWETGKELNRWRLIPFSEVKVFPDYIPHPILEDYKEACLIKDLSPKASATLSRRCLQGMIRDFWGIKKKRLIDEIEALKDKIDSLTWKAINAVKEIGNIGAHMEKDINLIIDVDPNEASQLINLIEMLLKEWYINRYERQKQLNGIVKTADIKKGKKSKITPKETQQNVAQSGIQE